MCSYSRFSRLVLLVAKIDYCVPKWLKNTLQYEEKNGIIFVRWNDNSVVTLGSAFGKKHPIQNVSRYSRTQKKKVLVPQPRLIEQYNSKMGGVDLCDNFVANYRIRIRGKK